MHIIVMRLKGVYLADFYSEETVNNQGLECLRFLNEVISDFDAVRILTLKYWNLNLI